MNPSTHIAPIMSNNESLRRLLDVFVDQNGNPRPGSPGGPTTSSQMNITKANATGPLPTPASLIVAGNPKRTGILIVNQDDTNTIWYSADPAVTDATGFPLAPLQPQALIFNGPIYAYCLAGTPSILIQETLMV